MSKFFEMAYPQVTLFVEIIRLSEAEKARYRPRLNSYLNTDTD